MFDYPALPVKFPAKNIFLRLGGHLSKNEITAAERSCYEKTALEAFDFCRFAGRWEIFPVERVEEKGIVLSCGKFIPSADFASRCAGITHLWCGAATAGKEIVSRRDGSEKISVKSIYDAVGAESADEAMDTLQRLAGSELRRKGLLLAERRFSPGYGDMPLTVQEFFFSSLHLAELDMSLSETLYITPEKSVTAFAGVWQGE
ncbi:MAG: hypothetical protein E7050_09580 [Lentisphaerae bacterium]|nr:hypothetical protein [Lentisphaerota bacterium]